MKKKFEAVCVEVIRLQNSSIVTASGPCALDCQNSGCGIYDPHCGQNQQKP